MTQLHSNNDSGIDPELLFALIDDVGSPGTSSAFSRSHDSTPDPAELGRTVGSIVGRSFGGAMGAEIGAILAPLFAGINDLEEIYSGTGEGRETEGSPDRERRTSGEDPGADRDTDSDASTGGDDDVPADGREMTREDGSNEEPPERRVGSRLVDDEFRKDDGPTADEDDERDAWGRREVGIDWPLPPECRLPMDS